MAEGTIDKLSIEVSSTASAAVSGIRDLASALSGLEGSIGGSASKLTRLAKGVSALGSASAALRASDIKQLTSLSELSNLKISSTISKNLAKISTALTFMPTDMGSRLDGLRHIASLNGVKLSATVPNNLTRLGRAMMEFPVNAGDRLRGLALAIQPLRGLNDLNLGRAITSLRRLPEALQAYGTLNVSRLVQQLDLLTPRLNRLAAAAQALRTAYTGMPNSLQSVARATRSVVSANRTLEPTLERNNALVRQGAGLFTRFQLSIGLITAAIHAMRRGFEATIGEVNTYIENMNLFEASMGKYTESATEFGNKVQDLMGIDFGQWARNQGVFQTLITGMGDTAERASVMSQQLTQLGYDISSFYNINVEDAMLKLQSGIAGELEPLRRIGWDLSNARMQIEATNLGIEKSVQDMTQAEKVGLRYYLIMKQVTQVHGDMARTIASPANQLRVLQAQLTLASRAIGELFIPMLNKVLPYVIAAAKAVRMLAQEIANFLGIDAKFEVDYSGLDTSGIASGIDDTADALEDAADGAEEADKKLKAYKNTVMGFDELNKLNDVPESSDAGNGKDASSGIGAAFDVPLPTYDFLGELDDTITRMSDKIAKDMVGALKKVLPVVAGIGAGIAAWKIGGTLLSNADKLARSLANASKSSTKLANNLLRSGTSHVGGRLDNLMGSISRSLGSAAGFFAGMAANAGKFAPVVAGVAAVVAIMVARTADLWINSEKFRRGVEKVSEWLGQIPNLLARIPNPLEAIGKLVSEIAKSFKEFMSSLGVDLSFLDPLLSAFAGVLPWLNSILPGAVEALDLDISDLGITALGAFLVFGPTGPIGKALGAALLVFEALTVAIRAIGWATSPCVESVDALADVSEDTAKRFGTSLQSMEDATRELDRLDFANSVVSEDDVRNIEGKVKDIHDTIVENLNGERNRELAELHSMAGIFTDEEIAATEERINRFYDDQIADATSGTDRINEILETASAENRSLSESESAEINRIKENMYKQLVEKSGAAEADLKKIDEAMKNNTEAAAVEAASTAIKQARERKETVVKEAEKEYDDTMRWAKQMLDANEITKGRYDEIEKKAGEHKTEMVNTAEREYDETIEETEKKLGKLSNKIDYNTGEIKSNWDVFLGDIRKTAGEKLDKVKKKFDQWGEDLGKGWDSFTSDMSKNWDDFCKDVEKWYKDNIEPTFKDLRQGADDLGKNVESFLKDPVGSIKKAWKDLKKWFQENVIDPIQKAFDGFKIEIPTPKLPHITWDWFKVTAGDGSWYEMPDFNVNWYGKGGLPDSGQLFVARENGIPELVGTMGSKNAVANNQQIVEGIEQGVMSAMLQVLPSFQTDQGGDVTLVLKIGNETVAEANAKGQASLARRGKLKPEVQFV